MAARFEVAPWPTSLKVVSLLGTLAIAGAGWAVYRAIPRGTRVPFAETFGTAFAVVPGLILLGALLFVVTWYELEDGELRVGRLFTATRVPLAGLVAAWHDPEAMRRSLRVFGNGGLYSVTGLYRNTGLGTYRAFVTDPKKAVVLRLPDRNVVISPAHPEALLAELRQWFPQARRDASLA